VQAIFALSVIPKQMNLAYKIYYSPTNVQVIFLKTILKFTLK